MQQVFRKLSKLNQKEKEKEKMSDYKVEIVESSKSLTNRERVYYKTTPCQKLVDLEHGTPLKIREFAVLKIDNDNSEDGTYLSYIFKCEDGSMYSTSSEAFYRTYRNIYDEMEGEEFDVEIYKIPGKKGTNNDTLLCKLV